MSKRVALAWVEEKQKLAHKLAEEEMLLAGAKLEFRRLFESLKSEGRDYQCKRIETMARRLETRIAKMKAELAHRNKTNAGRLLDGVEPGEAQRDARGE